MKFGVCMLSIVPVRLEPSDKSEMTTQLLFGDLVTIGEELNGFIKIRDIYDNYEGWADKKQVFEIEENEFYRLCKSVVQYTKDLVEIVHAEPGLLLPVLFGSIVRNNYDGKFMINGVSFSYGGHLSGVDKKPGIGSIIEDALLWLNAPYLWGGKTPFGTDCSGFTQTIFKANGVELLRDASQQASQGETISLVDEAEPGDLVFFDSNEGHIVHVGIYLGKNKIIHASGKVRTDRLDHQGIYNDDLQKYTHNLRLIKRLF